MTFKNIFFFCLGVAMVCTYTTKAAESPLIYQLDVPAKQTKHAYNLNPYFFAHYISLYGLAVFDLDKKLSLQDKKIIIKQLYGNLTVEHPVRLIIPHYQDKKDLVLSLKLYKQQDRLSMMMVSNYNFTIRKIAENESEFKDVYASLYFIVEQKLIKVQDLFSGKREQELKKGKHLLELADLYLFDEKSGNDKDIKHLLQQSIQQAERPLSAFYARVTLAQYYLSLHDFKEASRLIEEMKTLMTGSSTPYREDVIRFFKLVCDEYVLTEMLAR